MSLQQIQKEYDKLQSQFGDKNLKAIYGGGCESKPEVMFIFMNPTATNLAAHKNWSGVNFPFIGTKNAFKVFNKLNLLDDDIYNEIVQKSKNEWTEKFAQKVLEKLKKKCIFVTNLAKCTQIDAKKLKNTVFINYLCLLEKEINLIKPKKIICFGNQVSSIFLSRDIKVGKVRKQKFIKNINGKEYETYAVYYPIGMGMRNLNFVIEDISHIL